MDHELGFTTLTISKVQSRVFKAPVVWTMGSRANFERNFHDSHWLEFRAFLLETRRKDGRIRYTYNNDLDRYLVMAGAFFDSYSKPRFPSQIENYM